MQRPHTEAKDKQQQELILQKVKNIGIKKKENPPG